MNIGNLDTLFSQYNFKPSGNPDSDLEQLGMSKEEAQSIFGDPQVTNPISNGSNNSSDYSDRSIFEDYFN